MCRWVAYAGPDIFLEDLLFEQQHSLISQSLRARHASQVTNGDGFGIAWYGQRNRPGLFRDILPAWNDENLRSLAAQVQSRLFFAHVRASTGTSVSRSNCHPFQFQNWVFMHNGKIGHWQDCRREVESLISPEFYRYRAGTSDSEALFMAALSEGLQDDPVGAMSRAIGKVLQIMAAHGDSEPFRMSAALTDGTVIWAFRFSSDQASPSLYYGNPDTHAKDRAADGQVNTIASEPSDDDESNWHSVPEGHGLRWSGGRVSVFPFLPA